MKWRFRLLMSLAGGALLGAIIAGLKPVGSFWIGWLSTSLLTSVCLLGFVCAWVWAGSQRLLAWMIALAFFVRLAFGIGLNLALPAYGYDKPNQKAGYLFPDAYNRDKSAWNLAQSDKPVWSAFTQEFFSDQYGGMLFFSALIYRVLSPDAHRSYLILILAAFAMAIGVPFFWKGIQQRWGSKVANLAAWILIFYPDGIYFTSSQMREPFIIGATAIAFWAVLTWPKTKRPVIAALAGSIIFISLISWRIAIPIAGMLFVWFLLENFHITQPAIKKYAIWIIPIVGVLAIGAILFSWRWLKSASWWDFVVAQRGSGQMELEFEFMPSWLHWPFLIGYGLCQVLLPAAIFDPANPVWKSIAIFRSVGWYALVPLLAFGFFAIWKIKEPHERWKMAWLVIAIFAWMLISSGRAAGDMTDNPRYRTYFLPWMALLAAWALQYRHAWLWRVLVIEGIFLTFFTLWYVDRYIVPFNFFLIKQNVVIVACLAFIIIAGGVIWDIIQSRKKRHKQTDVALPQENNHS